MKKFPSPFPPFLLPALLIPLGLNAGLIQSVPGPDVVSGGVQNVLIDTTTDTGDWMDAWNVGSPVFFGFDFTIDNNVGETGAGGFFGGLNFYNGSSERAGVGNDWASLEYGPFWPGHSTQGNTGIPYVLGETVRLVAEVDVPNDSIRVWVNPSVGDLGSPDGSTAGIQDLQTVTRIVHRAGNGVGQTTMENFVVADDFATAVGSTVPEPGSVGLLGLGFLWLVTRRCIRR